MCNIAALSVGGKLRSSNCREERGLEVCANSSPDVSADSSELRLRDHHRIDEETVLGVNVAFIMSVYRNDKREYVSQAVESILRQSYAKFDLFIQYDGCVDKDVDAYLSGINDKKIHIFRRDENKGLAYSLNELLGVVMPLGYDYIARMDADDISEHERLEKQIDYLENHPDVDCVGTWAIEINSKGEEYFKKQMPETHEECLKLFKKRDCMIHPTVLFRRRYIEKSGLYALDTYFGEDTMMWAQGFKAGCRFANVPEYLFKFRIDEHFFERRRGWKHAKNIFLLRHRVNKMLGFGLKEDSWALAYASAKMMPKAILNLIYKTVR